ncbi:MAG: hypothetical protein M4579_005122 [Chaenotheca gracillima]|nr:MAG: hypothetical protein M4579_005122 [Chaenotheca gracillima]
MSVAVASVVSPSSKVSKSKKRSSHGTKEQIETSIIEDVPTPPSDSKKRKRNEVVEEIEVDVSAPEPPSKKALRKAKKGKSGLSQAEKTDAEDSDEGAKSSNEQDKSAKRSEYGIWIGNLAYSTTKPDLRNFLMNNSTIPDDHITRVHLPGSGDKEHGPPQRGKPQNKGFAYIDLKTPESLTQALLLSEKLLAGRKVLIKDSKSFEGRPEKPQASGDAALASTKPPSKRIFVGNLGFDVTHDDLREHFEPCGEVEDIHMATFEDTGKCKGFAWVRFQDVEAATAAVRGWTMIEPKKPEGESESDDEEEKEDKAEQEEAGAVSAENSRKKPVKAKGRKWWVNRIKGRSLRMEFAEDKAVRYRKRFGKEGGQKRPEVNSGATAGDDNQVDDAVAVTADSKRNGAPQAARTRPKEPRKFKPVDARTIKPGAALANAQRSTAAIQEGKGKKTVF